VHGPGISPHTYLYIKDEDDVVAGVFIPLALQCDVYRAARGSISFDAFWREFRMVGQGDAAQPGQDQAFDCALFLRPGHFSDFNVGTGCGRTGGRTPPLQRRPGGMTPPVHPIICRGEVLSPAYPIIRRGGVSSPVRGLFHINIDKREGGGVVKKVIVLLALVVFVAGLVFVSSDMVFAWGKKDKEEIEEPVVEAAIPAAAAAEAEGKPIYTFKNDEEMGEFEQLYIAKQATFGRMGVLQAYFSLEQNNLAEIDRQMNEKFGFSMNPAKIYDLNRDTKEIKEMGDVPGAQPVATP